MTSRSAREESDHNRKGPPFQRPPREPRRRTAAQVSCQSREKMVSVAPRPGNVPALTHESFQVERSGSHGREWPAAGSGSSSGPPSARRSQTAKISKVRTSNLPRISWIRHEGWSLSANEGSRAHGIRGAGAHRGAPEVGDTPDPLPLPRLVEPRQIGLNRALALRSPPGLPAAVSLRFAPIHCSWPRRPPARQRGRVHRSGCAAHGPATSPHACVAAIEALKNDPTPELLLLVESLQKDENEAIRKTASRVAEVFAGVCGAK